MTAYNQGNGYSSECQASLIDMRWGQSVSVGMYREYCQFSTTAH